MKLVEFKVIKEPEKPREKIIKSGVESLNNHQLLAAILSTGYGEMNVQELSKHLLAEFGSKGLFQFQHLSDFQSATGLPLVKSCQLLAISEYYRRLNKKEQVKLLSTQGYFDYIKNDFKNVSFEQLRITCLDEQKRVLYSGLIAQGKTNQISVSLKDIFYHPIRLGSPYFYLAHNHPKGISKPSKEDIEFTLKLKIAARKFDLDFKDHIIIGEDGFYSFALKGFI